MSYVNKTTNQHFISQAEQKLNSLNPAAERKRRKIYRFSIIDRDVFKLKCDRQSGVKIEKNLSEYDLFTYFINDDGLRHNLENVFNDYESSVLSSTQNLMCKLEKGSRDITYEITNLLLYKLMNFIRNPHCIEKVLNTFEPFIGKYPLEPSLLTEFKLIKRSNKNNIGHLANRFSVSDESLLKWIKLLFLMLMRIPNSDLNIIESVLKNLLEDKSFIKVFQLNYYDDVTHDKKVCMSDKAWVQLSEDDGDVLAMQFNISSKLLMTFCMSKIESSITDKIKPNISEDVMNVLKKNLSKITCKYIENDMDFLAQYNRRAIYQSKEHVFCAAKSVWGAEVI